MARDAHGVGQGLRPDAQFQARHGRTIARGDRSRSIGLKTRAHSRTNPEFRRAGYSVQAAFSSGFEKDSAKRRLAELERAA